VSFAVLPEHVHAALAVAATRVTSIVATVDEDGRPRTAPFGSMYAPSPDRLRFGCDRGHATFANLCRDPRVAVCLIVPPGTAVTVFGLATVVREAMDEFPSDAVVDIRIDEVKDDMLPGAVIDSGVRYSVPPEALAFIERYIAEIRRGA